MYSLSKILTLSCHNYFSKMFCPVSGQICEQMNRWCTRRYLQIINFCLMLYNLLNWEKLSYHWKGISNKWFDVYFILVCTNVVWRGNRNTKFYIKFEDEMMNIFSKIVNGTASRLETEFLVVRLISFSSCWHSLKMAPMMFLIGQPRSRRTMYRHNKFLVF